MTPEQAAPDADDGVLEAARFVLELAREGETARLAAYLDAGAPVDLLDAHGNSLVMLAAYHGHADTVAMLAGRGADVDLVNDRGQSPLAGAVFKGEDAVVRTLLAAGADPAAGTPTAYETAAMFGGEDLLGPRESGASPR